MRTKIASFLDDLARRTGERIPDRKDVVGTLKKAASAIPFSKEVISGYYCAIDEKTPKRIKGVVAASLAYLVLPADVVPDILPAVGFTDDVSVLTTMMAIVASHLTDEHRGSADRLLDAQDDETPSDDRSREASL